MRVFRSLAEVTDDARNSTVSIGNFDGVHEGHRQLFRRNVKLSGKLGTIPSVVTFHPHPARVIAPERAPRLLTTIDDRIRLMGEAGIDQVFVIPFNREFSRLTPEDFARKVLAGGVAAKAVLVGDNFRFGSHQAGDVRTLQKLGQELGFITEIVPAVRVRGRMVSSSEIRSLIEN